MKEGVYLKNKNTSKFISSLIYAALGLVLILYPTLIGETICWMLAGAAAAMGAVNLIGYAMSKGDAPSDESSDGLATGIVLLLLAVFIVIKSEFVISIIPFVLGFMITVKGVVGVQSAINLKRFGYGSFKGSLIAAVLVMAFGIVMMMNPFSTVKVLFTMIGIGLLVSGVVDIAANIMMTREMKKFKDD